MMLALAIGLVSFLADPAFALSCPSIRLDQGGRSMARLPVYDQGTTDLCYAYTASQMLDAYRASRGQGGNAPASSPLAIAVAYSALRVENGQARPRPGIHGGSFEWAINTVRGMERGICGANELSRHLTRPASAERDFEMLEKIYERNKNARGNAAQARAAADALRAFLQARGFTAAMVQGLGDLNQAMSTPVASQFFHRVVGETCKGRELSMRGVPAPRVLDVHKSGSSDSRESDFGRYLKEIFGGANPQPVGIGYCADFLNKASLVRNLELNPSRERPGAVEGCETEHASVVVGSREKNGRCEFLIRNTFGSTCKGYDRAWDCENGQIWVSETALVKNTNRAAWLEGPEPRP
jgi:hypothetical protein